MSANPENDVKFQQMLTTLIRQISVDERLSVRQDIKIDSKDISSQADLEELLESLVSLRINFVVKNMFARFFYNNPVTEIQAALSKLNEVRNTKEIQDFLNKNLYFFTEIDRLVFRKFKPSFLVQRDDYQR